MVVCNKQRRGHRKLETLYYFADSCNRTLISLSFNTCNSWPWGFQNAQNILYILKAARVTARFELATDGTNHFFKILRIHSLAGVLDDTKLKFPASGFRWKTYIDLGFYFRALWLVGSKGLSFGPVSDRAFNIFCCIFLNRKYRHIFGTLRTAVLCNVGLKHSSITSRSGGNTMQRNYTLRIRQWDQIHKGSKRQSCMHIFLSRKQPKTFVIDMGRIQNLSAGIRGMRKRIHEVLMEDHATPLLAPPLTCRWWGHRFKEAATELRTTIFQRVQSSDLRCLSNIYATFMIVQTSQNWLASKNKECFRRCIQQSQIYLKIEPKNNVE